MQLATSSPHACGISSQVETAGETPYRVPPTACIIAQSGLASEYLKQALAHASEIHSMSLEEFVKVPRQSQSTVFIFDVSALRLPLGECMRRLQVRYAGAKYLVIGKVIHASEVARLLLLGVHGYLDDGNAAEKLVEAVHTVLGGKLWIASDVLQQYVMFTSPPKQNSAPKACAPTDREVQILELVRQRYSNKEIARMFNIQQSTIKFHLTNIFGKLRVANRRELLDRQWASDIWEWLLECKLAIAVPPAVIEIPRTKRQNTPASPPLAISQIHRMAQEQAASGDRDWA